VNLSFVVDDEHVVEVIRRLHQEFFSGELNPELFAELRTE
jgi:hypothetical protein